MASNGRTEKATPKRRGEARKKGQIGRSQSLTTAVVFVGVFYLLSLYGVSMVWTLSEMLRRLLAEAAPRDFTEVGLQQLFLRCAIDIAGIVFLVSAAAMVLGIGSNMAQGGLILSGHRLAFRFESLNPVAGFKKLLPKMTLVELLKAVLSIGAISYAAYVVCSESINRLPRLVIMAPAEISSSIGHLVYQFAMKSGVYMLVIGMADYLWSRRKFEESIKMTKLEIKDEAKNAEGNPEVRGRIRRKQREMALRNMMADVPKADVIITNPTHYAVALRYYPENMAAPTVVAKGKGYVALRIREIALENKVPLVENKPLAQSLFKAVDIGQQIPAGLFKAVAEVLAYVYRLKSMRL